MERDIISFLRETANQLEQGKLTEEQKLRVSEFFISSSFHESLPHENSELLKFLSLGFYIYTFMLSSPSDAKD